MNPSSLDLKISLRVRYFKTATILRVDNLIHFLLSKDRFQQFAMIQLDNLDFFLAFIEDIQNRRGSLRNAINFSVRYVSVFLLIYKLHSLGCLHVEPTIEISFALFVGDSVCDKRMLARWLLIEYEEIEIISVVFVSYYQ